MNHNIYPSQAANLLNISLGTLNNWRRQGYIQATPIGPGEGKGARYVYAASEIERILDRSRNRIVYQAEENISAGDLAEVNPNTGKLIRVTG